MDDELQRVTDRLGAVLSGDAAAEWAREEAVERRRELLQQSGVDEVLSDWGEAAALFEARCEATRALEYVQAWLRGPKRVLALFGPMDSGKTVAAAWALARHPGRYFELGKLADDRKGKLVRAALVAPLLVLDELGAEDDASRAAAVLQDLVNRRMRKHRTLLLGNLDRDVFEARYDARTVSRLQEVGVVLPVPATGLRPWVGEQS